LKREAYIKEADTSQFFFEVMDSRRKSYMRDPRLRLQDAEFTMLSSEDLEPRLRLQDEDFTTFSSEDLKDAKLGTQEFISSCFIN